MRISAILLLFACSPVLAFGQNLSGPYLERKHFQSRSKALSAAVFLAEGNTLATSSLEPDARAAIQVWNVKTGECTRSFSGHGGGVFALAASRDGRRLASAGDGLVLVHDVVSGKEITRISFPPGRVLALAFAPDGLLLAAAGEDRRIHFLDTAKGNALDSLAGHDEAVTGLAFSADGKTLYTGSYDGTVRIWDVAARKLKYKLLANGGRIHGVAVSADGKMLAAACAGNPEGEAKLPEVALWNLDDLKQKKSLQDGYAAFTTVQFSATGSSLAAAKSDGWILSWSADGSPCSRLRAHQNWITSLSYSPNGSNLVTTSWEPEARLWDLPRYTVPVPLPGEFNNPAALVFAPGLNVLIAGGMDKVLHVVDPAGKQLPRQLQLKADNTLALAVSSDGKYLASSGGRQDANPVVRMRAVRFGMGAPPPVVKPEVVTLWELESGKELHSLAGHKGLINVVSFSPNSRLLASGSADKTIRLWDVSSGVEQMELIGHASSIVGLSFHPNGKTLASASDDGSVRIWDLRTGQEKRAFQAHPGGSSGLAISPDGRRLATCSAGDALPSMALWDMETGENRWSIPYSGSYLSGVIFSPNGRLVMALGGFHSEPGLVRIADAEHGRPRNDLMGGKTNLTALCISSDGKSLFATGQSTADKGELLRWTLPSFDTP